MNLSFPFYTKLSTDYFFRLYEENLFATIETNGELKQRGQNFNQKELMKKRKEDKERTNPKQNNKTEFTEQSECQYQQNTNSLNL